MNNLDNFPLNSNFARERERESIKKLVSEYDQEMSQSQTADQPTAPRGRGKEW